MVQSECLAFSLGGSMHEVTLILNASGRIFESWVEQYTQSVSWMRFPTERGRLCLQQARRSQPATMMALESIYLVADATGERDRLFV